MAKVAASTFAILGAISKVDLSGQQLLLELGTDARQIARGHCLFISSRHESFVFKPLVIRSLAAVPTGNFTRSADWCCS